jgi:hypothetical protein
MMKLMQVLGEPDHKIIHYYNMDRVVKFTVYSGDIYRLSATLDNGKEIDVAKGRDRQYIINYLDRISKIYV